MANHQKKQRNRARRKHRKSQRSRRHDTPLCDGIVFNIAPGGSVTFEAASSETLLGKIASGEERLIDINKLCDDGEICELHPDVSPEDDPDLKDLVCEVIYIEIGSDGITVPMVAPMTFEHLTSPDSQIVMPRVLEKEGEFVFLYRSERASVAGLLEANPEFDWWVCVQPDCVCVFAKLEPVLPALVLMSKIEAMPGLICESLSSNAAGRGLDLGFPENESELEARWVEVIKHKGNSEILQHGRLEELFNRLEGALGTS